MALTSRCGLKETVSFSRHISHCRPCGSWPGAKPSSDTELIMVHIGQVNAQHIWQQRGGSRGVKGMRLRVQLRVRCVNPKSTCLRVCVLRLVTHARAAAVDPRPWPVLHGTNLGIGLALDFDVRRPGVGLCRFQQVSRVYS